MYYRPETKQVFNTHSEIRAGMPNVLFPQAITDDILEYCGVFPVTSAQPLVAADQVAVPGAIEDVDGAWTQTWVVRDATPEEIAAIEASAQSAPPAVPDYVAAIQAMLDAKVSERRYYTILSACSYATSTNPTFKAEADACMAWRDAVWAKAYATLDEVTAGTIAQPTVPELLAMLPTMTWPT